MKKLDIILRTCNNSKLQQTEYTRFCGVDREEMIFRCLLSLINTINNTDFDIKLTVLDDDSDDKFVSKLQRTLINCIKDHELIRLEKTGFNNSAYEQFLLASQCEDLVYTVEDDYLHEENALTNLLNAYAYLSSRNNSPVVLHPFDCPFRYEPLKEEPTYLFHDGTRYWRQVTHTTNTIFTESKVFKEHFFVFKTLALQYPKVLEEDTINKLYTNFKTNTGKVPAFNPIPSVAYHLSYAEPPEIKTTHLSWKDLWSSGRYIDIIDGWFNYRPFYTDIALNNLPEDAIIYEVGGWLGKSTIGMSLINERLNRDYLIYCVDTWEGSDENDHREMIQDLNSVGTNLEGHFKLNVELFGAKNIIPLKMTSEEASKSVEDASLDMVIIDASHEYDDVTKDIGLWLPKVKKGGILAGDDYSELWPTVRQAVDDYFGKGNFNVYTGGTWFIRV